MACSSCAHVVLVPTPFVGHCIPFFYLASRLASQGLKVTFLVPDGFVPPFYTDSKYKHHVGVIQGQDIDIVAVQDGFSREGIPGLLKLFRESSEAALIAAFGDCLSPLMSNTELPAPSCIVSDMLMGWTQGLAARFAIPRFVLHTQSAANLSLMLHATESLRLCKELREEEVPTLIAEGRLPFTANNQVEPVLIPGLKVPLLPSELPSDLHPGAIIPDSYETFLRTSRRAAEAPIVLINTFRELEDDVFATLDDLHANAVGQIPKVIPVGPLLPPAAFSKQDTTAKLGVSEELDESIVHFLNKQPHQSVLYIAFGTAGLTNGIKYIRELALALEASGQPFLWAEAPSLINPNAPTLTQLVPPGFEERTKERGLVVSAWAPQLLILQHPATGAFLSHCGWNSVLESIAAGLPILAWPQRAEQKMNSRFLVDVAKVAAEFQRTEDGTVTRTEMGRVVRLVMQEEEGEAMRSNMNALKECAARNACSHDGVTNFIASCEKLSKNR